MNLTALTSHERHEIIRDTFGFWAPVMVLLARAVYLRLREQRTSSPAIA